jgi:hypothetical protein
VAGAQLAKQPKQTFPETLRGIRRSKVVFEWGSAPVCFFGGPGNKVPGRTVPAKRLFGSGHSRPMGRFAGTALGESSRPHAWS